MSHKISLSEAIAMTSLYRNHRNDILKPEYEDENILCISETFDRSVIDALLREPDCQFLRIYYGMSEDFKIHAIIVGADSNGADILPIARLQNTDEIIIVENGNRCPDLCPPVSVLNS